MSCLCRAMNFPGRLRRNFFRMASQHFLPAKIWTCRARRAFARAAFNAYVIAGWGNQPDLRSRRAPPGCARFRPRKNEALERGCLMGRCGGAPLLSGRLGLEH
jgi:hypothetical protein